MSTQILTEETAWINRWSQPTVEALVNGLKPHQQRNFGRIIEFLDQLPDLQRELLWYGASWKWTIHYSFAGSQGGEENTICYIVPNTESPVISIPLSDELIARVPMRRLSKFIREGIKSAKCAVEYHWANWTPGLDNETTMVIDLLKRKHRFMTGGRASS